ncbi:MAG: hypothetical protein ABUL64_01350 [Singulisphaera sp.]
MFCRIFTVLLGSITVYAILGSSTAKSAPTTFSVDANGGVGLIGTGPQSTPQFIDTGVVSNIQFDLNSVGRGFASATYGHVGGHADIQSMRFDSTDWHAGSDAIYDDYVYFSGPAGATSVLTSLNLVFGYEMNSSPGAVAGLRVVASVNNVDAEYRVTVSDGNAPQVLPLGLDVPGPAAFLFSGPATTPQVSVPIGSPVHIVLRAEMNTGAANHGSAFVNFDNSLDFVRGRDLFTLPEGFTVNAETSYIVDNRFVLSVPEPPAWVFSVLGLASALFMTLKRQHFSI